MKKIASNRLLSRAGWIENPLIELSDEGEVVAIRSTAQPDREPFTSFRAGLLVIGVEDPQAVWEAIRTNHTTPLDKLLAPHLGDGHRALLFSGLDYRNWSLSPDARWQPIP
ncbi:MAG: cytosine deaminase [Rikenellaceae bacterium]|nr:cytosine deaminase [Rikenellaceae bacterium]